MTLGLYAIRSKPRKEETLWGQLLAGAVEAFYLRMRVHPVNPKARRVARLEKRPKFGLPKQTRYFEILREEIHEP